MTQPTSDLHLHVSTTSDPKGLRQTANELDRTTKATDRTRKATDQLGDSFHDTVRETKDFNEQLRKLYVERFELAKSYQDSGDREVMREFNRANRRIAILEKLSKAVASSGAKSSVDIIDFGGKGIRPTNALMGGAAVALAAAMPALGAMLGGALSGTAVGTAMAGGILAASRDPSVQAAAQDFGQTISREFFASGDAFVDPVRNSLNILEADFQDLELEGTFAKVAPQVEEVAHGIGDMVKNAMPGLNKALDRSDAYTDEFTDGLRGLGSALGSMIDDMSSSEGSVEGLNTLFGLLNGTLVAVGMAVNALADTWDAFTDVSAAVTGALEDIPEPLQKAFFGHSGFAEANDVFEHLNSSGFGAAGGIGAAGGAAGDAAGDMSDLAAALHDADEAFKSFFGMQMSIDEARLAVERTFLDLQKTLQENGGVWDAYSEKGIENRDKVLAHVEALEKRREAELKAADGNQEAIDRINANYDAAIARLETLMGTTADAKAAFKALAGTYTVTFYLQQKVGKEVVAWSELRNAERQMESHNAGDPVNRSRHRAAGGPIMAGVPYMINERGMETVTFPASGTVHPANLTPMASNRPVVVTLRLDSGTGTDLERSIIDLVSKFVRVEGGGSAEAAFSGGRVLG